MTFIPDALIQTRAAEFWRRHGLEPGFDIEVLLDDLGLSLLWDDPLPGEDTSDVLGALKANEQLIILNERHLLMLERNPGLRRFTVGHEIGHWVFHGDDALSGTLPIMVGDRTWCRTGSKDPVEIQADLFASYLLIPTDRLKALIPPRDWRGWPPVYRLAEAFVVSASAMMVRLERAGWAHRDEFGEPVSGRRIEATTGQLNLI